jgi:hypothetical protein
VVAHVQRPRLGLTDRAGGRVGADPGVEPDRIGTGLGPFHDDPVEMLQPQPHYWLIKHRAVITDDHPRAKPRSSTAMPPVCRFRPPTVSKLVRRHQRGHPQPVHFS